jgi:hypothetical protein
MDTAITTTATITITGKGADLFHDTVL